MSKRAQGLTVGSLLGVPQWTTSAPRDAADAFPLDRQLGREPRATRETLGSLIEDPLPGSARGAAMTRAPSKACCRSGCAGCPWAEAQRAKGAVLPVLGR